MQLTLLHASIHRCYTNKLIKVESCEPHFPFLALQLILTNKDKGPGSQVLVSQSEGENSCQTITRHSDSDFIMIRVFLPINGFPCLYFLVFFFSLYRYVYTDHLFKSLFFKNLIQFIFYHIRFHSPNSHATVPLFPPNFIFFLSS